MLFEFESDFAGSLRCIPMIVRQKLDLAGIKLSLRQWSRFSREDRGRLAEFPCETAADVAVCRSVILGLIESCCDEPAVFLGPQEYDVWQRGDRMPEAVESQAAADGVAPPAAEVWADLSPLQRFALIKLARSKHENENFVPAMKEFGIL
ncbi:nitrate reductase associated protein [Acetobacter sp. AN02]|uniref:nitrate reductase associated protein n=1 Tax=Acetobacter sp. AN02 TaxID=2894186 RepID=UPI0024345237|nr:nitrate reductase associated protein [Acetobacter sp. AN02]MDG6093872.1 nitrate reductase associated protein [Acetobacter sp. AN02]